ncbi:serine--tRNA ligase [Actinoplanes awajinensis]|uniref:Serine--tRNA ligase n=1 Tax=Actinoplanes awajinensis subsp. mycoplanecinus TaxID=135947 RepID=A0A0X3UPN6_9ACTN|nr:serine--tRNA ligase [Actinoplanes awajinensis]KUL34440.1 serine--tRNA ligase [Actinoplanes awajinensis subsp. mycoplanecinus]
MIDLRLLREDPELIRASQRLRGESTELVDSLLRADEERRAATQRFEALRAEQRSIGKQVAKASGDERAALLARTKDLSQEVKAAEAANNEADQALRAAHLAVPNVVQGAPPGGEDDFIVLRTVGDLPEIEKPLDHLEIGEALRAIDTERGAKVSGSRFYFLTGVGALLQLGMLQLAIQQAVEHGFTPTITPTLVRPEAMEGTGYLGAHASEVYHLPADDLYLVGTSEVALAAYHSNEIIDLSNGPARFAGWSSCYRREAGSHGKDVRGILRVHQFDKVEMYSFCKPEDATEEHQRLLAMEEEMLAKVEIPYRVIDVAAGDLGTSAVRKFDCEAWVPSQSRYREVTSTSNTTTFQARRLNVRYRDEDGKPQTAATLNGTLATTRWLIPILENHQLPDGSVRVPKALQPFLGGREILEPSR